MQSFTIYLFLQDVLHISDGFSVHHQELKTAHTALDQYLTLYMQFWAPDDGRKNRLKHVERLAEINKLWKVACCWLYSENFLKYFSRNLPWRPHFTTSIRLWRHVPGSNIRNIRVKTVTATLTVDETQSPKYSSIITVVCACLKYIIK